MHAWHKVELRGLETSLKVMRILPFLFSPLPPTTTFRDIDGSPMADLTETSRFRHEPLPHAQSQHVVWFEGAATQLVLAFVRCSVQANKIRAISYFLSGKAPAGRIAGGRCTMAASFPANHLHTSDARCFSSLRHNVSLYLFLGRGSYANVGRTNVGFMGRVRYK